MSLADDVRAAIQEELKRHLEDHRDLRSQVPSLVLVYPVDQHYLKSGFVGQKWVLKLCCMFPGGEHPLYFSENDTEGGTNPARGVYILDDLGELSGPIIKWMSSKAKIVKVVFPQLGRFFDWLEEDSVAALLKSTSDKISGIPLPESSLPSGGKFLPIPSEYITLNRSNTGAKPNKQREF